VFSDSPGFQEGGILIGVLRDSRGKESFRQYLGPIPNSEVLDEEAATREGVAKTIRFFKTSPGQHDVCSPGEAQTHYTGGTMGDDGQG
jgi:hypothetical protein